MSHKPQSVQPQSTAEQYVPPAGKPRAIICDLDGTLSLLNGRSPYDATHCDKDLPNTPVIECVKAMDASGCTIIFTSGREDKHREPTKRFIEQHCITLGEEQTGHTVDYALFMRQTGDQRKDAIVKREIFDQHIRDHYQIVFVLDDRDQVVENWRAMGLTCFQVAPGCF